MQNKKAQTSIEVIIALGIILIILFGAITFYIEKQREVERTREYLEMRQNCLALASGINMAYTNGNGYNISMKNRMESDIIGPSKIINVKGIPCNIITSSVLNDQLESSFMLDIGEIVISNVRGNIFVKNVQ